MQHCPFTRSSCKICHHIFFYINTIFLLALFFFLIILAGTWLNLDCINTKMLFLLPLYVDIADQISVFLNKMHPRVHIDLKPELTHMSGQ